PRSRPLLGGARPAGYSPTTGAGPPPRGASGAAPRRESSRAAPRRGGARRAPPTRAPPAWSGSPAPWADRSHPRTCLTATPRTAPRAPSGSPDPRGPRGAGAGPHGTPAPGGTRRRTVHTRARAPPL